jgi:hypothetical protein
VAYESSLDEVDKKDMILLIVHVLLLCQEPARMCGVHVVCVRFIDAKTKELCRCTFANMATCLTMKSGCTTVRSFHVKMCLKPTTMMTCLI